jgi:hypothetical protein
MVPCLLSTLVLVAFAFASPNPNIRARQNQTEVVLKVTHFTAFAADPYVDGAQSNLSFHVIDPRPEYYAEVDCVVPNTYFNLYAISALFDWCNRELGFDYMYSETGLIVRRGWKLDK